MADLVTLDDLKRHLRIEHDADDAHLADLRAAAVEYISVATDTDFNEIEPEDIPERAKHVVRLLVGHWYEHREGVLANARPSEVPLAIDSLILQLRGAIAS